MAFLQPESNEGRENEEPPVSRAEQLLQAHPDIRVLRSEFRHGLVEITQRVGDRWRNIEVEVKHEEGSQRHYPTVLLSAYEEPHNGYPSNHEMGRYDIFTYNVYGLTSVVKIHVEDDEQVKPEVGYGERRRYPPDFTRRQIRYIESYANPIPAQVIVATARIGLEMLKAYREASLDQKVRIYQDNFGVVWDKSTWAVQFYDGEPGREDMDTYIASVLPRMGEIMSQNSHLSINASKTKAIYALNALNKVTDAMLPSEMPPAPVNRREPRRRAAPGIPPVPGRRAAGR